MQDIEELHQPRRYKLWYWQMRGEGHSTSEPPLPRRPHDWVIERSRGRIVPNPQKTRRYRIDFLGVEFIKITNTIYQD